MIVHWIIFSLILVFIFYGCIKYNHHTFALNKKFNLHLPTVSTSFLFLLFTYMTSVDLFYMSIFNGFTICIYIFGIIAIILALFNLNKVILRHDSISTLSAFYLLMDFLVAVGISIYLVYIIPDDTLRNILTTVVAALYGGYITLVGVSITINHSRNESKKELGLKNKPLFFLVNQEDNNIPLNTTTKTLYATSDAIQFEGTPIFTIEPFVIYNGDYSYSSLYQIDINGTLYRFTYEQLLNKNSYTRIKINIDIADKDITSINLIALDMLDNIYSIPVNFEINNNQILIRSTLNTTKIGKLDNPVFKK